MLFNSKWCFFFSCSVCTESFLNPVSAAIQYSTVPFIDSTPSCGSFGQS